MITNIAITPVYVTDQDVALDFYTSLLGFEEHTDADLGPMRWLSVCLPGARDRELLLIKPGPPPMDEATAAQVVELVGKGAAGFVILNTDDVRAEYQRLKDAGVEITQEPTEQPYGTDMAFRDPFGNQIRLTQLPAAQV